MPGNRQIYEQAMNMGHSAAWDQEWDKAIAAYGRAVQEMPEDPAAHNSLGLALLQARRLEDALKVYTRAHHLAQDDPIPLEKCADVLERLGRAKEAAQQYINVAEIYLVQRDLEKAISNWERAVSLTSGLVHIHQRLALAYERTGQRRSAIREYLTLAFHFQRASRPDVARQAVERALRLEPNNPQALNTLQALESGALIPQEVLAAFEPAGGSRSREHDQAFDRPSTRKGEDQREIGQADVRGPIGEAVELALESLAEYVFASGDLDRGGANAIQAIEFQRQEMIAEAIQAYNTAVKNGLGHAAVYLNLGHLNIEQQNWADAISNLQVASADKRFAAGAMHGLSIAYAARGKHRMAANHIVQTLRLVDVDLALTPDEAVQLSAIYDRLTMSIDEAPEEKLSALVNRFLTLLTGSEWKQRVAKTRRQLEEAISLQTDNSLIDIALYIDANVTQGLNLIDRYQRQGLHWLAMDQAHFMLESAPDYLPIHQRIAQLLLERDNISAAMTKFNLVAATYHMRGDTERATSILHDAIRLAPMNTDLRKSLINLLTEQGNNDELLDQYIDLADAYYQLADLEAARDTYQKAIKLAQKINSPAERVIHIMHRLGDIEVSRLELKQALRTYEQIRKMAPDDEHARRVLVDLNYRLNDPVSAISELDGLLRVYARNSQARRIIQVLEELVTRYPKDMALRSRLAAVYRQTGNLTGAIDQLSEMAELQLQNGLQNDAIVTIQQIIGLNPPNVSQYRTLLAQLTGQAR